MRTSSLNKTALSYSSYSTSLHLIWGWSVQAILLITVLCLFIPFQPNFPGPGLDGSWVLGVNEAVAHGWVFGQDIVFTFGPYSSIYTKNFHPATDLSMMLGSLFLGLAFGVALIATCKNTNRFLLAILWIVLAGLIYARDTLLFTYPLLVAIYCFNLIDDPDHSKLAPKLGSILLFALFFPFGLLPLIKGSLFLLIVVITGLCAVLLLAYQQRRFAQIALASPLISVVFFWCLSGALLSDLPSYFSRMLPIISGYTEAMELNGNYREIIYYVIASVILLITIGRSQLYSWRLRLFLFLAFFCYLFLSFKGGFVRHDEHAFIATSSLLLGTVLLAITLRYKNSFFMLFISLLTCWYISNHYVRTNTEYLYNNIKATYANAWNGFVQRYADKHNLHRSFEQQLVLINRESPLPVLSGNSDIYANEQSYLIASGNRWNPRPVFQSYSVYTPELAELNRQHVNENKAPDNLFFRIEPIDGRIPSGEDGKSWPVLLSHYHPVSIQSNYLLLKKIDYVSPQESGVVLSTSQHLLGEEIVLPSDEQAIFAEIEIKQSLAGKLVNFVFKPSQLAIHLHLQNGEIKTFRLISGIAKAGLFISPLVENTQEFSFLFGHSNLLADKKVKSISVDPVSSAWQWNKEITLRFKKVELPTNEKQSVLGNFAQKIGQSSETGVHRTTQCDGGPDVINGVAPRSEPLPVSGLLEVKGWFAISVPLGLVADKVVVVLNGEQGQRPIFSTSPSPRTDVAAFFKQPKLNNAGFETVIDTSELKGKYQLSLGYLLENQLYLCPKIFARVDFKGQQN